jgi:hypothetical protein
MSGRDREELSCGNAVAAAIAKEEARLAALEREREDVQLRLTRLREELAARQQHAPASVEIAPLGTLSAEMTASAKVALFRDPYGMSQAFDDPS